LEEARTGIVKRDTLAEAKIGVMPRRWENHNFNFDDVKNYYYYYYYFRLFSIIFYYFLLFFPIFLEQYEFSIFVIQYCSLLEKVKNGMLALYTIATFEGWP